jgi:hypothetical protein
MRLGSIYRALCTHAKVEIGFKLSIEEIVWNECVPALKAVYLQLYLHESVREKY